jgi:hypothetical protein
LQHEGRAFDTRAWYDNEDLKSPASDAHIRRMKAILRRLLVRCWEGPPDPDAMPTTRGTTVVGPKTTRSRELLKVDSR